MAGHVTGPPVRKQHAALADHHQSITHHTMDAPVGTTRLHSVDTRLYPGACRGGARTVQSQREVDFGHDRGHARKRGTASSVAQADRAARCSRERQCRRAHQRRVCAAAILPSSPSSVARAAAEPNGPDNGTSTLNPTLTYCMHAPTRPANPPS